MQGSARQGPGGPEIWVRGPVADAGARPAADDTPGSRGFAWVAAHGGAGASTLAGVFGGLDAGRRWPCPEEGEPSSVLLVARTHASGLGSVLPCLGAVRRGEAPPGLTLDAVVLVADAPGRLPRPLAQRVKAIESVIGVHRVPWVPAWRTGDLGGRPPRALGRLARMVGTFTQSGSGSGVR